MNRFTTKIFGLAICIALALSICHLAGAPQARAQKPAPSTAAELLAAMKLTEAQQAEFKALEQHKRTAEAGFQNLDGEARQNVRNAFYAERQKALKALFTEEQLTLWTAFWKRSRNATPPDPTPQPAHVPDDDPGILGRKGFVHVEQIDGVWFMVNADGERFVPTGMNHVGPMSRFAPYNRDFWLEQFGPEIYKAAGQIDWQGPGVKRWLDTIAKDHKDYGFNTLAFHHPHTMPTEYCNQLELYYFGKMRMSHIHARRAKTMSPDGKFPDVFDPAWLSKLDAFVEKFTSRHKDAKYLLGYSYDDLPAYTINNLEKRIAGFEHHPWILDIISKPGLTDGKRVWIDILKAQYPSAAQAGDMYGISAANWNDFGEVTEWGLPKDPEQGFVDQAMMNAKIIESYLKAHHDAIRRHDPNHLILGDKIQNARPHPDWVWKIVKKYVDVIVIQDYDFFTPEHEKKLRRIHALTGKPIINGDHAYGVLRPNMQDVKGVKVDSAEAKGQEYATYLRGIMNLPFMLGWQTCGYLETWEGTADNTGKQQTGYFEPFGEPVKEALSHAKTANQQAVRWHEQAGSLDGVYSNRRKHQ